MADCTKKTVSRRPWSSVAEEVRTVTAWTFLVIQLEYLVIQVDYVNMSDNPLRLFKKNFLDSGAA